MTARVCVSEILLSSRYRFGYGWAKVRRLAVRQGEVSTREPMTSFSAQSGLAPLPPFHL